MLLGFSNVLVIHYALAADTGAMRREIESCWVSVGSFLEFKKMFWPTSFQQQSGVDGMITIFCDFRQFSAKKWAFFSKTNAMIKILHNLALF
jgi:hypothetical protein